MKSNNLVRLIEKEKDDEKVFFLFFQKLKPVTPMLFLVPG